MAHKEAGIAKVQQRYPGGTRAFLVTGFSLGKHELSDSQKKYIEKMSGEFDDSYEVKGVLGFADKSVYPDKAKSDQLNTELAEKRAKAVGDELKANDWGFNATIEGEGPTEVLGPRGYNRSVLIVIGPK